MKITKKDYDSLWGDGGPYSEAKIVINTRILDDSISRVMVEVTGNVNPTTYKIIKAHREEFINDRLIQELLDTARYRSPNYGYVFSFGTQETSNSRAMDWAQIKLESLTDTLIRMHKFVMKKLDLENNHNDDDLPEGITRDQIREVLSNKDFSDAELLEMARIFNESAQDKSKPKKKK